MLYSRLNNEELERWSHSTPHDQEAKAELLRRVPGLVDQLDADLEEARSELQRMENLNDEQQKEVDGLESEVGALESKVDDLTDELAAANARIADLTRAEDLV